MALVWLSIRLHWRRAWSRSLAVALLIGGVGGFILAAAASARRVEDTYQAFIKDIDAPDVAVVPACGNAAAVFGCTSPLEHVSGDTMVERLEGLEVVEQARSIASVMPYVVDTEGRPLLATDEDQFGCVDGDRTLHMVGLASGSAKEQAMPFRLDGDLPRPGSAEVVLPLATAKRTGIDVGDTVRVAGWCNGDGDPVLIDRAMDLTVTGVSIGPLDIDPPGTNRAIEPAYVDAAAVELLVEAGAEPLGYTMVWLDRRASLGTVSEALAPYEIISDLRELAIDVDKVLATDARPLWLLAGVGLLGGVLLLAPIVGRHARDTAEETTTMVALGSTRKQIAVQGLAYIGVLALVGGVVAAVLAPAITSLMPRGFAVTIAPQVPVRLDGLVTAIGVVLLVLSVLAMGAAASWGIARRRESTVEQLCGHRGIVMGASHLRPAARTGVLTAVGSPAGPRQFSPWPSFVSLAVAGATCVGCLTYLAGLRHLERTPSLVGWNWGANLEFDEDTPELVPSALAALDDVEGVEQATLGTYFPPALLQVVGTDITVWPWSFDTGPRAIAPAMASGRAPDGPDEVAINAVFARAAGLDVGDTVSLSRPSLVTSVADEVEQDVMERGTTDLVIDHPNDQPVIAEFEITGIAVLPLQRLEDIAQASMTLEGLGALVTPGEEEVAAAAAWLPPDLPDDMRGDAESMLSFPDVHKRSVYIRLSGDVPSIALAISRIPGIAKITAPTPEQVLTLDVGLDLNHNDRVPVALVYVVSIAAAALLIYLLYTAVRARRFEFAVMRAVGLSSGGVRWSIAAQATATAVIPLVVALPVGVVVGRRAWMSSARDLDIVAVSVIPWFALAVVVAVAIAIANIVVLVPGWTAVRKSSGRDLRAG